MIIGEAAVHVLCRCENEYRIAPLILKKVDRAFDICQKDFLDSFRRFVEMRREMNDDVVVADGCSVNGVQNVEPGGPREIIRAKIPADMCPEVSSAARYKEFHLKAR